jgi:hypothetical protein
VGAADASGADARAALAQEVSAADTIDVDAYSRPEAGAAATAAAPLGAGGAAAAAAAGVAAFTSAPPPPSSSAAAATAASPAATAAAVAAGAYAPLLFEGIENANVSALVDGHVDYRNKLAALCAHIGLEGAAAGGGGGPDPALATAAP